MTLTPNQRLAAARQAASELADRSEPDLAEHLRFLVRLAEYINLGDTVPPAEMVSNVR